MTAPADDPFALLIAQVRKCSENQRRLLAELKRQADEMAELERRVSEHEAPHLGEQLKEQPKAKGAPGPGRGKKAGDTRSPAFPAGVPTLADLGITKKESERRGA